MTKRYITTEPFQDWDGQHIRAGEIGELAMQGASKGGRFFWNLIRDGAVIAVTLGRPPVKVHRL
jgi:hypothetical protein